MACLSSLATEQKSLVVCDIDDTLKLTHVKFGWDFLDVTQNFATANNSFIGMPSLLQSLAKSGAEISYVTAMPELMNWQGQRFLSAAKMPLGTITYRPSLFVDKANYKTERILDLIRNSKATRVLLLGDNAEADETVFLRVKRQIKNVHIDASVHDLYLDSSLSDQLSRHLTAADLSVDLFSKGWLTSEESVRVIQSVKGALNFLDWGHNRRAYPDFSELDARRWALLQDSALKAEPEPGLRLEFQDFTEALLRYKNKSCLQAL